MGEIPISPEESAKIASDYLGSPEKFRDPFSSREGTIYHFLWGGKPSYILKEIKPDSQPFKKLGKKAEEVAAGMQAVYDLAKKYFGDELVPMSFIPGKNDAGEESVLVIHPEIVGPTLEELAQTEGEATQFERFLTLDSFQRTWEEMKRDRDWKKLPRHVRHYFSACDIFGTGVVKTENGELRIIDF